MEEVFQKRSNLVMPKHYVELDSEEMSYIEGGDYYINNNTCNAIMGTAFAGIYIGGVTLATAIACGVVTKATISGMIYGIMASVSAVNLALGGLLATIGKFALEVIFSIALASCQGRGVNIETLKIWKVDTRIPMGVAVY